MTKYVSGDTVKIETGNPVFYFDPQFNKLSDGGWVAAWEHSNYPEYGTAYQRFDPNGATVGSQILLSGMAHEFASLPGGGWAVVYNDNDNTPVNDVYMNIYDNQGAVIAAGVQVNSFIEGYQTINDISALADGGWVVTWSGFGADNHEDTNNEIYQQRYNAAGLAVGTDARVNTNVERDEVESRVVGLEDGGWIVSWTGMTGYYTDARVHMQRYDDDGNMVGPERQVHDDDKGAMALSAVAALPDGGWLVASTATEPFLGTKSLLARFNASGEKISETETGRESKVAVFDDGGFVVAYFGIVEGGDGEYDQTGIFAQVYNANGSLDGHEYLVDSFYDLSPGFDIDIIGGHDFIVTWQHAEAGAAAPVEQRRYSPGLNEAPVAVNDTATMVEGRNLSSTSWPTTMTRKATTG